MFENVYRQSHQPGSFGHLQIVALGCHPNPYGDKTADQRTIISGLREFAPSTALRDYWNGSFTPQHARQALSELRAASGLAIVYFHGPSNQTHLKFPVLDSEGQYSLADVMERAEFLNLLKNPLPKIVLMSVPNSDFGPAPGNTLMVGIAGDRPGSYLDAILAADISYAARHPLRDSLNVFLSMLRCDYHNRPLPDSDEPGFDGVNGLYIDGVNGLYKMYCMEKANGKPIAVDSARIAVRSSLVMDSKPFEVDPTCNFIR